MLLFFHPLYWPEEMSGANTASHKPITRPIWKSSRNKMVTQRVYFSWFIISEVCMYYFLWTAQIYFRWIEIAMDSSFKWWGLGLWCFQQYLSYIVAVRFIQLLVEKITALPQVTDKLCTGYTLTWVGFELTTLVVIGTDCIDSYKYN